VGHGLSLSAATATEQEESRKKIILKIRFLPISVIARTYLRAHSARCACIIPCRKTTTELGVPPPTGGRSRNVSGSPLGRSAWRSTKPDRAAACAARERIAASASADDDNARRVDAGNRTRNHGLRIRRWHNTCKNTKSTTKHARTACNTGGTCICIAQDGRPAARFPGRGDLCRRAASGAIFTAND
jgi:hypothetical protein